MAGKERRQDVNSNLGVQRQAELSLLLCPAVWQGFGCEAKGISGGPYPGRLLGGEGVSLERVWTCLPAVPWGEHARLLGCGNRNITLLFEKHGHPPGRERTALVPALMFRQPGEEQRAAEMQAGKFWMPTGLLGSGRALILTVAAWRWVWCGKWHLY